MESLGWPEADPATFGQTRGPRVPLDDLVPAGRFAEQLVRPLNAWGLEHRKVPVRDLSNVIHHAVGLGREVFEAVCRDPERLVALHRSGDPRARFPDAWTQGWGFESVFEPSDQLPLRPAHELARYLRAHCPVVAIDAPVIARGDIVDHPEHGPGFVHFWDLHRVYGAVHRHTIGAGRRSEQVVGRTHLRSPPGARTTAWVATLAGANASWELFVAEGWPGELAHARLERLQGSVDEARARLRAVTEAKRAEGFVDPVLEPMVVELGTGLGSGASPLRAARPNLVRDLAWGLAELGLGHYQDRLRMSRDVCQIEVDGIAETPPSVVGHTLGWIQERLFELGHRREEGVCFALGALWGSPVLVNPDPETPGLLDEPLDFDASEPVRQGGGERRYRLEGGGGSFDAGTLPDGRQVLMAAFYPCTFAIVFDAQGRLLAFETRESCRPFGKWAPDPEVLARWQTEWAFRAADIEVERFYIEDLHVGISDLPEHFYDIEDEPDPDERARLQRDRDRWVSEGSFVLQWGNELWMDRSGRVTSS